MAKARYTRRPDGRFATQVWDGTYNEETGKKHYVTLYSTKSSKDLETIISDFKASVKNGSYVKPCDLTFQAYAQRWYKVKKASKEANTVEMYKNSINAHMIPLSMLVGEVTHIDLQNALNLCKDRPRTCQILLLAIRQVVRAAVSEGVIAANQLGTLLDDLETPRYRPTEKRALFPEEKEALKTADFSPREKAFVWIIYGCGLRRGEALALTRADIDFKAGVIHVTKAVAFPTNDKIDKDTKNLKERDVPMPTWLVPALKQYVSTIPGMLLFTKMDGKPITKSSYIKMWMQIVKKMNLAAGGTDRLQVIYNLTAHVFRHNYCTQLCYAAAKGKKLSINKIAELMGDSREMVLKVYSHVLENMEEVEDSINEAVAL